MSKKVNYLSCIPLYGTCIVLIYLFSLAVKEKISKKRYTKIFWICAIVSALCWTMTYLILYVLSTNSDISFLKDNWFVFLIPIAGYMMNAFTFTFINKKWVYLTAKDESEKTSFLQKNKKKILFIALILSVVITIVSVVLLTLFGII